MELVIEKKHDPGLVIENNLKKNPAEIVIMIIYWISMKTNIAKF